LCCTPTNQAYYSAMFSGPRFTLLISLATLLGCGVTPTPPTTSSSSLDLTGNWGALAIPNQLTPGILPTPIAEFNGALASTNGTVIGVLRAFDPTFLSPCVPLTQDLAAIGTLDAANNLTLTVPISGGIATITATLPQNLHSFISGSWQISGGACAMPATAIWLSQYASATGTYTGTYNVLDLTTHLPVPGTATAITATLTQSVASNADGQFPLTGTITATGACTASLTFTNGTVMGGSIRSNSFSGPANLQGNFSGAIEPTANTLNGAFTAFSTCNFQSYVGRLTRQ
jgi:hypothetical protein